MCLCTVSLYSILITSSWWGLLWMYANFPFPSTLVLPWFLVKLKEQFTRVYSLHLASFFQKIKLNTHKKDMDGKGDRPNYALVCLTRYYFLVNTCWSLFSLIFHLFVNWNTNFTPFVLSTITHKKDLDSNGDWPNYALVCVTRYYFIVDACWSSICLLNWSTNSYALCSLIRTIQLILEQ